MNPILPTEETIDYEDRLYLNPQIGLDESNQFIENLRETQDNNIAQIQTQTQRLGTDVPSSLGGLTGPGSYFTSRYATPQNLSTLQNLRTAAQATALNQVLENEEAMWKKRYQEAYRNYQSRAWNKQNNAGDGDGTDPSQLPVDVNTEEKPAEGSVKENTNTGQGNVIPVTDYVNDYQDSSGQWWVLGSIRAGDSILLNSLDLNIRNAKNGDIVNKAGQNFIFIQNDQYPDGVWFRATKSAGPGTYSPYAGENE